MFCRENEQGPGNGEEREVSGGKRKKGKFYVVGGRQAAESEATKKGNRGKKTVIQLYGRKTLKRWIF